MDVARLVREIVDFPKPGIRFKDITPILRDPDALRYVVDRMAETFSDAGIEVIVGVESRGFLLGAPLAYKMETGFVLIRKPGKLPAEKIRVEYDLEYGKDALEIHRDAIRPGQKVLLVDDLLATGGTIGAAAELVQKLKGNIVGFAFLIELAFLGGRSRLDAYDARVLSLVRYEE